MDSALQIAIKQMVRAMQVLEEECYKSTFTVSVFALDLKTLDLKIRKIEEILKQLIEKEGDNQTSQRLQIMNQVLEVFERKCEYFIKNVPNNKDDAANECQLLQSSFQVFTELYDSFL
jgi:hypothetical protein